MSKLSVVLRASTGVARPNLRVRVKNIDTDAYVLDTDDNTLVDNGDGSYTSATDVSAMVYSVYTGDTAILVNGYEERFHAGEGEELDQKITATEVTFTPSLAPASSEGKIYYDETDNAVKVYNGSIWERISDDGVVDVRDYGAVGDGVTDDTAAIRAAISSGVEVIALPKGTYLVTSLVLDARVSLVGDGHRSTIINVSSFGTYNGDKYGVLCKGEDSDGLATLTQMSGLKINITSTEASQVGVLVSRKVIWRDVYVDGATSHGIYMKGYSATESVFFSLFENVWSKNNGGDGIRITENCNANQFIQCQFDNNGAHGFHQMIISSGLVTAAVYNNNCLLGQTSYNQLHGYYFENGSECALYGCYSEYNSQVDGGNPRTGAYKNLKLGASVTRCFAQMGSLGTSTNPEETIGLNTVASNTIYTGGLLCSPFSAIQLGYDNTGSGRQLRFKGAGGATHEIIFEEGTSEIFKLVYDGTKSNPTNEFKLLPLNNGVEGTPQIIARNNGYLAFFGSTPISKPTVTGSKDGNAALTSLIAQLSALGLITDSTT